MIAYLLTAAVVILLVGTALAVIIRWLSERAALDRRLEDVTREVAK